MALSCNGQINGQLNSPSPSLRLPFTSLQTPIRLKWFVGAHPAPCLLRVSRLLSFPEGVCVCVLSPECVSVCVCLEDACAGSTAVAATSDSKLAHCTDAVGPLKLDYPACGPASDPSKVQWAMCQSMDKASQPPMILLTLSPSLPPSLPPSLSLFLCVFHFQSLPLHLSV